MRVDTSNPQIPTSDTNSFCRFVPTDTQIIPIRSMGTLSDSSELIGGISFFRDNLVKIICKNFARIIYFCRVLLFLIYLLNY